MFITALAFGMNYHFLQLKCLNTLYKALGQRGEDVSRARAI